MNENSNHPDDEIPTISAVDAIRAKPDMYVGEFPTGALLLARLVETLILLDAAPLRVGRAGAWYSVYAERDWLMRESGVICLDAFQRLIPLPSGGRFYDRAEVMLTALADAVVTSDMSGVTWISGEPDKWPLRADVDLALPLQKGRTVAFHYFKPDPLDG
ncbi:hypothetical protein G6321_00011815 [Bradyrhizobium barranii subsp. barranii]|uniref:Uncharacterized protein n=1 Tax=Bradyrhizobium barranii subsp. barranii TaxID=2823807 RepID=A0A7Z0TJJ1_9BRAD|nr:hypothetical protein [Bradyrhizobium barranii]UGX95779.1 hypothetical protein G6321_00011815 [Bradyrhizobium barranii subsp. barranii]